MFLRRNLTSLLLVCVVVVGASSAFAQTISVSRQFGTSAEDSANGIAVFGEFVYVVGVTQGVFPGEVQTNLDQDFFLAKYDRAGTQLWVRQFAAVGGTNSDAVGIAANATGVYLAGSTQGALTGHTKERDADAFVMKFDEWGNQLWIRQFGAGEGAGANDVVVTDDGVYVVGFVGGALAGQTYAGSGGSIDAFIRLYDRDRSWGHRVLLLVALLR